MTITLDDTATLADTAALGGATVHGHDAAVHRSAPYDAHAEPAGALRFFWSVLAVAAIVSVVANGYHAWVRAALLPPLVAALVATIAPVALLAATHGVALLLRSASATPLVRWSAVAITFCIAAGGFRVSFDAQTDLATQAGQAGNAWVVPLLVDGFILQATIAVVALSRPPHQPQPDDGDAGTQPAPPEPAGDEPDHWSTIARRVCATDPAGRRDPDQVARILRLRHIDGLSHSKIAKHLGDISTSTVTRILTAARAHTPE